MFQGTGLEARAYEQELRRAARKTPTLCNPQFEACIPDFMQWYRTERLPRTVEATELHIKHLQKHFGRLPLTAITTARIEHYKRTRLEEGVKPITINKELNGLSVLLKWAKDNNLIGAVERIKLFPGKMTRSPVPIMPPSAELEAVVMEVRPEVRGLAMLEYYAGLRRNEALHLRAEDVLLERKLLIVTGKGGKQRIVPIPPRHTALIEELTRKIDEVKTGYLWVNPLTQRPYGNIVDSLKGAAERCGVKGRMYNHLLRHGFGTTAVESGIDIRTLQVLLGHSTSRTTELYSHLAATHLIAAMDKFNITQQPRMDTVSKE